MKADLSISQFTKSISRALHRYHVVIFALVVMGSLSFATYKLYQATASTPAASEQKTEPVGFDKQTIEKVNKLRASGEAGKPLTKPTGRTNPFQ